MSNYAEIIETDEKLNALLNKQDISIFTEFRDAKYDDASLKEHIAEPYFASFKKIMDDNFGTKNEGKVTAFFRSVRYLANKSTEDRIAGDLAKRLDTISENLEEFKNRVTVKGSLIPTDAIGMHKVVGHGVTGIFNSFGDHPLISEKRSKILSTSLDICDVVSTAHPENDPIGFRVYNEFVSSMKIYHDLGEHKARYDKHASKINRKQAGLDIKYVLGALGIVLFIALRIILKMMR